MNAELYRLKTSRDEGKYALMHEGREWVFACALTQYAADAERSCFLQTLTTIWKPKECASYEQIYGDIYSYL